MSFRRGFRMGFHSRKISEHNFGSWIEFSGGIPYFIYFSSSPDHPYGLNLLCFMLYYRFFLREARASSEGRRGGRTCKWQTYCKINIGPGNHARFVLSRFDSSGLSPSPAESSMPGGGGDSPSGWVGPGNGGGGGGKKERGRKYSQPQIYY